MVYFQLYWVSPNAALAIPEKRRGVGKEEEEERDGVSGEERTQIGQRKGFRRFPQGAQG